MTIEQYREIKNAELKQAARGAAMFFVGVPVLFFAIAWVLL